MWTTCTIQAVAMLALMPLAYAFTAPVGGSHLALRGGRTNGLSFAPGPPLLAPRGQAVSSGTLRQARTAGSRVTMQSSKSAGQQVVIAIVAFGFLFGAIYPLANNSMRFAMADKSMSGSATKMRQSEIDERLRSVPVFSVTDSKGSPYVADMQDGKSKGFFFLDPKDAQAYMGKVKELNGPNGAAVKITPTTLDRGIAYIKGKTAEAPFEIFPSSEQVPLARKIKNPDSCDICWGSEDVKEYVPVFWVSGLALEVDNGLVTPIFFEKDMAVKYWEKLGKSEAPDIEVFDLSALIKKLRKGGSTEFRKVNFFPSIKAVEFANTFVSAPSSTAPPSSPAKDAIFPDAPTPQAPAPATGTAK